MKLTSKKIAELLSGILVGPEDIVITGAAGLEEAVETDISFVSNPKYLNKVEESKAGLLIVSDKSEKINKPVIKVLNPQLAFAKILELIAPEVNPPVTAGIHKTAVISHTSKLGNNISIGACAVIDNDAVIGDNAVIYPGCYVGVRSSVGESCLIYPNVSIRENVSIGKRCIIHSGTVIGSDGFGFARDGKVHHKIPQLGGVEIGNDVEIGANVTIDRATMGKTQIGNGTKIDNLVQIAHNVRIGENCIIVAQVGIAGSTYIGDNVVFAGQSGTVGHVSVGSNSTIAGRSVVTTDIKEGELVSGFPARPHREAMRIEALIRKLPEIYEKLKNMTENKEK